MVELARTGDVYSSTSSFMKHGLSRHILRSEPRGSPSYSPDPTKPCKEQRFIDMLHHYPTHDHGHGRESRIPIEPILTTYPTLDKATSYFEVADPVLGSLSTGTPLIPFSPGWLVPDRTPTPVAPESEATGALPGLEATVSPEVWPGALGAPVPSSGGGLVGSIQAGDSRVLVVDAEMGGQI